MTFLDMKQGDVTGDGIMDKVYLVGRKHDETNIFADHITLIIQDGASNQISTIHLQNNTGYNAKLFLGDFSKDNIFDILVSIDSGGSGGYGIFYIYSFRHNIPRKLFDFEKYNADYIFKVNYEDYYTVSVGSLSLDLLFTLDISYKGDDYLSQLYNENGKLKQPVQGQVLSASALYPIVANQKSTGYDLLVFQRIIGISNSDTLGYVENLLTWNGTQFISTRLTTAIQGTKLISLY
ncbi:VCBS repeat-containing protein [Niallia endozanthoxylica]|uniref:VCBS repeat-containing protein n=1 Tax=Niallia endozanthoxylica TaxID=2036016 RepID=A0A5J5HYP6_9BACI|nr:VCBS repeat-containing protein [Niallia endozanthoxylica]